MRRRERALLHEGRGLPDGLRWRRRMLRRTARVHGADQRVTQRRPHKGRRQGHAHREKGSRVPPQTDVQLRHLIANYYGMIALIDHNVGRYVADAEAIYSYEGTREMNTLIVGKEITGLSAFI